MKIFGAGFAGLIAGCVFPKAHIYERNPKDFLSHQALLRFRTDKVSEITGIKFKKVQVLKSIWSEGKEVQPTPRIVAMYSHKVTGKYENRSIINIDTTNRYIAPSNFHELLIKDMADRINFDWTVDETQIELDTPIISTLPLSINAKMLGYDFKTDRNTSCIYVNKYKVKKCDMYCTIYYPDNDTSIYRASITGDILTIESKSLEYNLDKNYHIITSLGLYDTRMQLIVENHKQMMGKITQVNDDERRVMIYKMSHDHDVFSLGRFAIHKNVLLDDIAKDVYVIKSMINDDAYGISTMDRL